MNLNPSRPYQLMFLFLYYINLSILVFEILPIVKSTNAKLYQNEEGINLKDR